VIRVLRVDDRLLHGQVAVAWTNYFKVDVILVANDKLITDMAMQTAFKLAAPPEVTLSMKSLAGAVMVINNPKHSKRKIMVITQNMEDAMYLCNETGEEIKEILIGGLRKSENKKQINMNSYMGAEDITILKNMEQRGIELTMQADPTSKKLSSSEIIKIYESTKI